ncbi:hypothetical protein GTS_27390 [Gandjariella thermophila]|uniref:Uncharacterized protein n=1 Tax=Gandjariella thermophila TaxID=1931992 RepID=A0A4D4J9D7_9PSEU|nr:hypothetical protein GTS_27390 [Gandjariella thermophila]
MVGEGAGVGELLDREIGLAEIDQDEGLFGRGVGEQAQRAGLTGGGLGASLSTPPRVGRVQPPGNVPG